jgi:RNA polymerase-interacting CarD/CdnL/TRCF family regulator
VVASVPIDNVAKSGLRHLISKDEVKEFFKLLGKPLDTALLFEPKLTKEALYLNDPIKTVPILKLLFQNKIQTAEKFARTNSEVMEGIVKHLADEIVFVTKKSFKSIHSQILSTLKKSSSV